MSKTRRSWNLFRRSAQVIWENKKLLLFPIVITFLTCVIALFFFASLALTNTGHSFMEAAHWKALASHWGSWDTKTDGIQVNYAGYGMLAGLYLVSMFLTTFFNVAFYNEILNALNGRPVSISGGFRFACSRLKAILTWSIFTGLVGLVIKSVEEHVGLVARWVVRLIGTAWSVASVFAVPVIIREDHANPMRFLKSSASLLRKTWGESLIGYVGITLGGWVILLGSFLLLGISAGLSIMTGSYWFLLAGLLLWLATVFVLIYALSMASQVYRCALYIYATEGVVPGPFEAGQMDMAWKVNSGRKPR